MSPSTRSNTDLDLDGPSRPRGLSHRQLFSVVSYSPHSLCFRGHQHSALCAYSSTSSPTEAQRPERHDAASPAVMVWFKGDGSRSVFCRLVSSIVSSNSEGAGSLGSRSEVADVDGVDCWGSRRIRGTLICADSCFEAARHVCLELLSGSSRKWHVMCVVNLGPHQIREVAP